MKTLRIVIACLLAAPAVALVTAVAQSTSIELPIPQLWQHKDLDGFPCVVIDPPFCPSSWAHPELCGPVPPYGNGCHHCAANCAPAAVMMYRTYRGYGGCPCSQDCLYDGAKSTDGETMGNRVIESHGVGMLDAEVQQGFLNAMGEVHAFGSVPGALPWLTSWNFRERLFMRTPLLWIDRDGFPEFMPPETYYEMYLRGEGHAKIVAGYDDMGTYCDLHDDLLWIYDPWPSPDDCPYPKSPYPVPLGAVVGNDARDLFLVDRVGGIDVASTMSDRATARSNARSMVRDPLTGMYGVLFVDVEGVYFARSWQPWDPERWSPPYPVALTAPDVNMVTDPALVLGPPPPEEPQYYGVLHAFWAQRGALGSPATDIYHSESGDGGQTWAAPERVYFSLWEESRHPSADVDGFGNLHLVWDETGLEMGREILYSTRPSGSDAWTQPDIISATPTLDSSYPALATSYDGQEFGSGDARVPAATVHVAWSDIDRHGGDLATVHYRWLDPFGDPPGWNPPLPSPPEDVTQPVGGTGPSLIVGPDRVPHVVWTSSVEDPDGAPTVPAQIYYSSREGGVWGVPQLVNEAIGLQSASVAPTIAFANGPFCLCKHVVWEEWDLASGLNDLYLATFSGMQMGWVGHSNLTHGPMGMPRSPTLAYRNGTDFTKGYDCAWTDPTFVFDYRVRVLGTSQPAGQVIPVGEPGAREPVAYRAWPNPFTDGVTFVGPETWAGSLLRIFDARGRMLRAVARSGDGVAWSWDGRDAHNRVVPPGIYIGRIDGSSLPAFRVVRVR